LAYVAAVLERAGHDVDVWAQDVHHYPDDMLTAHLDANRYDMIGIGVIAGYYQYRRLLRLSEAINRSRQRPTYVIGGHGPAPEPEYFMRKTGADVVVIGEGEETIVELAAALADKRPLAGIAGIAYRDGDRIRETERRTLIRDLDSIPFPAYHKFDMTLYRLLRMPHCSASDFVLPVLSARGCTFRCTFCFRLDKGYRMRRPETVVEEIRLLQQRYGATYIAFSDELLMASEERTEDLCKAFIAAKLDIKWDCNGRLNYARPDLLRLMKQAGCVFINYGIEAMDNEVLKKMKKGLRVEQVIKGIEMTLEAGISPGFNIIFGNIGDNRETLKKGVDFLLKYDDGAQLRTIRPVTPYPGTPLYYDAIERGLLKDAADFYENKHINSDLLAVNFTDLSDDDFHEALCEANSVLIEHYMERSRKSLLDQTRKLYRERDASFRGFRRT
jgi:radical SAM superfamily enzyme YgiQ (UPF0313 family)